MYGESPNQIGGRIASTAAVTAIGRTAKPTLREKRPTVPTAQEPARSDQDGQGGSAEEDDRRDVLPDVVGAQAVHDAEEHAGEERAGDAAETAHDGDDQREGRQLETRVDRQAARIIDVRHRDNPGQRAAQREDDRADERRVDPDEPRPHLVLDHRADAASEGGHTEEEEEQGCDRQRDHRGPDASPRHRHAEDRDRIAGDVDVQRAVRVAPGENSSDDEGGSEREQQPQKRPLLAALAVDGSHQREVEEDGDSGSCQDAEQGGDEGRPAVVHHDRGDDRGEHHDLPVSEVENATEAVDEGHADAEQPERETEDDPVEDDRGHWSTSVDQ